MSYAFLAAAIICEVIGTLLLPVTNNFTRILPVTGVMLVALASFFLFGQALQWQVLFGLVLIVIGVMLVNIYSKVT